MGLLRRTEPIERYATFPALRRDRPGIAAVVVQGVIQASNGTNLYLLLLAATPWRCLRRCAAGFSLFRVWGCAVGASSWVAASVGSVAWSAVRAGGCVSLVWRPSLHSFSGAVAAVCFRRRSVAAAFAARWAARVGVFVAVRRVPGGWAASVPVALGCGGSLVVAGPGGGVRGVAAGLRALLG